MSAETHSTFLTTKLSVPKWSAWQCRIAGVTYIPQEGQEPNAFHRWAQRIAFGAVWERRPLQDKGLG